MITTTYENLAEPPVPEWVIRITVAGAEFDANGALRLAARVGDIPVEGVFIDADGNGFIGYLGTAPIDGDHLFVGYDPSQLSDTGVAYVAPVVPPNV